MNDELEQLAERSKRGDREAFSQIVRLLQQQIFRYCYPMIGNKQDAEDAVQEVFVRAYEKLHLYRENGSFTAWMYKIAHNVSINMIHRRRRLRGLLVRFTYEYNTSQQPEASTDETLALLSELSAFERSLVILKVIHDKSYNEISVILGGSPAYLRKKYERAKAKLQRNHGEFYMKERVSYES